MNENRDTNFEIWFLNVNRLTQKDIKINPINVIKPIFQIFFGVGSFSEKKVLNY